MVNFVGPKILQADGFTKLHTGLVLDDVEPSLRSVVGTL